MANYRGMNMTYKIAACDDEQIFVDDVVEKIKERSGKCEIFEYASGDELLNSSFEFNIVFLDIEMTGINGINAALALCKRGSSCYSSGVSNLKTHIRYPRRPPAKSTMRTDASGSRNNNDIFVKIRRDAFNKVW